MKITLCGSTRFMEQFHAWGKHMALNGHVVYSVATSVKGDWKPTEYEKTTLDLVHLAKIEESDYIFVITCPRLPGEDQIEEAYIGESTAREIQWADIRGKCIVYSNTKGVEEYLW